MNGFRPRHNRATWRWSFRRWCNAPTPRGRCRHRLTGVQRTPVPVDGIMQPGPVIIHRPCGHSWLIGHGWMIGYGWDHSAVPHKEQ